MAFSFTGSNNPSSGPATSSSLFGNNTSTTATGSINANTSGFGSGFGAAAGAPATTSGFHFGGTSPAPAPLGGGLFGGFSQSMAAPTASATATTATGFASFGSITLGSNNMTNMNLQQQQQQQQQQPPLSRRTKYVDLPPQYRKAVDDIHQAMMQHRKIMVNLQSTGPQQLVNHSLTKELANIHKETNSMDQQLEYLQEQLDEILHHARHTLTQAIVCGKYPLEQYAYRRGFRLHEEKKEEGISSSQALVESSWGNQNNNHTEKMRELLEQQTQLYMDRIEHMPSPFMYDTLHRLEKGIRNIQEQSALLEQRVLSRNQNNEIHVQHAVERQHVHLANLKLKIGHLRDKVEQIRLRYRMTEQEQDVLEQMQLEKLQRERNIDAIVQAQFLKASQQQMQQPQSSTSYQAHAPSTNTFGGFSTPAPAPSTTGIFGNTGNSFGTPAPSSGTGGLSFGGASVASPAPTASSFGFGSSATSSVPSQKKKSGSRSSSRLRR